MLSSTRLLRHAATCVAEMCSHDAQKKSDITTGRAQSSVRLAVLPWRNRRGLAGWSVSHGGLRYRQVRVIGF